LVKRAAPYFQYVDIIEMHHEAKIDSPSGTALALAQSLAQEGGFQRNRSEKEPLAGTRGGEVNGVGVHSIRMAGRSAHHEVIFGTTGQTFSLRHDTLGRDCYMPGVLLAIREVVKQKGLVIGLERLLGL
jgi:4-hydroxy-tetrahydrodipicolinate reductase